MVRGTFVQPNFLLTVPSFYSPPIIPFLPDQPSGLSVFGVLDRGSFSVFTAEQPATDGKTRRPVNTGSYVFTKLRFFQKVYCLHFSASPCSLMQLPGVPKKKKKRFSSVQRLSPSRRRSIEKGGACGSRLLLFFPDNPHSKDASGLAFFSGC